MVAIFVSIHFQYTHKVADPFESFDILYDKPWQRLGPYIVGMITGYIIVRKRTAPNVPMWLNLVLWFLSIALFSIIIFGVWKGELSVPATALYVSLGHTGNIYIFQLSSESGCIRDIIILIMDFFSILFYHTAWGVALVWICLSCYWGLARPVNNLLSYRGFYPLSRLTYCTYLIHPVIMVVTSFKLEAPMHLQHVLIVSVIK